MEAERASGGIDSIYRGDIGQGAGQGAGQGEPGQLRAALRGRPEQGRAGQRSDSVIDLAGVRAAAAKPKLSTVADEHASSDADVQLSENEQILERGEQARPEDIELLNQETAEILADLKGAGIDVEEAMAAADELVADADTYAKAARAAAACGFNHA